MKAFLHIGHDGDFVLQSLIFSKKETPMDSINLALLRNLFGETLVKTVLTEKAQHAGAKS